MHLNKKLYNMRGSMYIYGMNYCAFIKEVLQQIEDGIDEFNHSSDLLFAHYPSSVEIEYKGVKITVPFVVEEKSK